MDLSGHIIAVGRTPVTSLTTLWKIVRQDGTTFRFTDLDTSVEYDGQTWTPVDGVDGSSVQKQAGDKADTIDLRGIISDSAINDEDLAAGHYRRCVVEETLIDRRSAHLGFVSLNRFRVDRTRWNGSFWEASITSLIALMAQTSGETYGRKCRYRVASDRCGISEGTIRYSNVTVTAVNDSYFDFDTDLVGSEVDDWFRFGALRWQTGVNVGLDNEVDRYVSSTGQIQLAHQSGFPVSIGDTCIVVAGCDRLVGTCTNKFNNFLNFGGFHLLPGTERLLDAPDSR